MILGGMGPPNKALAAGDAPIALAILAGRAAAVAAAQPAGQLTSHIEAP